METLKLAFLAAFFLAANNIVPTSSVDSKIHKRHTPFLPGDHWKDKRPEFGNTETEVKVMVNGTAKLKCPITHVADSSVSTAYIYYITVSFRF
jgi:hypothetical protein